MTPFRRRLVPTVLVVVLSLLAAGGLAAAQTDAQALGARSLRPYGHVFVAYAIAWLLVLGWAWSIARRLGKVEARLER